MARRPSANGPRGRAIASSLASSSSRPTPVPSSNATPVSSAYPSTYASEAEHDLEDDVLKKMHGLSISDTPGDSYTAAMVKKKAEIKKPFRFLDLPAELRITIYGYYFADVDHVLDLDPANYKRIHKKLGLMRTCKTIYYEATHMFYSSRTFRLFPTHPGRYFKTKKPLLARLKPRQRNCLTSLELRLGPGWSKPPRGWVVNPALGLADCVNVRKLTVFVECDPSDGIFNGFRRHDGYYEGFSTNLLNGVLDEMPFIDCLTFDAWSSVKKSGAMMRTLIELAYLRGLSIRWGPERGWTDFDDEVEAVGGPESHVAGDALLSQASLGLGVAVVA
ncbi:hypothetical protein QBC36DRAFT_10051 [Triangularia setosa]|uniref:DUF7730 domain-containing protein n=1 Tax=Triangularia setosa TaxID=2587417 RepID=A0AAN6W796_9PEZI|nr:hypothetical protein QBC36DRAFT_10051 [Podospora setosa]